MAVVMQCTLSGIDSGGFAWSNVFHIQGNIGAGTMFDLMTQLSTDVITNLIPTYQAACCTTLEFLDFAVRGVGANASYSLHNKLNLVGGRDLTEAMGSICPLIRFFPEAGVLVGGLYAVGCAVTDFIGDLIQPAYTDLLDDLITEFLTYDGTTGPHNFLLGLFSTDPDTFTPLRHGQHPTRPTTLNKRIRA